MDDARISPTDADRPAADPAPATSDDLTPVPAGDQADLTPAPAPGTELDGGEEELEDLPEMTAPDTEEADVRDIPLEDIAEIANIRPTYYGVEELAESFRVQGQIEPCMVRQAPESATHGKPWELVFGFRRKRAAESLGWSVLRCQVRHIADSEVLEVMLTENLQREDLSAIAAAKTMRALIDLGGLTQAAVARRLGVHPSHVSHSLKLLTLAPPVIEKIDKGEITASHGETLAALPQAQQEAFAERVAKDGVSVAKLSSWVRQAKEEEALPPPELPGALEPVTADDVTDLPRLYLREEIDPADHRRMVCYALLRNGNDQEILDWLDEIEGVTYERLWAWLTELTLDELTELERRLVRRYMESAHRFPTFEAELVAAVGDQDALEGRSEGVLTPALEGAGSPGLALPAAPLADGEAPEEGAHWADELDEAADDGPAEQVLEATEPAAAEQAAEGDDDQPAAPAEGHTVDELVELVADDAFESLLTEAFVNRQGLAEEAARAVALKLSFADDDIIDAALAWASDGELPDGPVIEGATPASLGARLGKPSVVFTALIRLREDPVAARAALVAAMRAAGETAADQPSEVAASDDRAVGLARAFSDRQGLDADKAAALSAKIMEADEDIREAALVWAAEERMPETPVIEDETPSSLAARLPKPSLVFTALMALRTNPAEARLRIPPRG